MGLTLFLFCCLTVTFAKPGQITYRAFGAYSIAPGAYAVRGKEYG